MLVRVAASSANLGSGFDCVGLALGLYDELEAKVTDAGLSIEVAGEGAGDVPTDGRHLVVRSIRQGLDAWGVPMPGLRLRTRNAIPHSRGLGSSAAAIVGGLALAWGIAFPDRPLDRAEVFRLSNLAEGHPDNAGASVYGGALLGWPEGDDARHVPLQLHPDLRMLVYVPDFETPTAGARRVLPDLVPRQDAVVQACRSALLMHALTTAPELLLRATEDRLHQDYRADLMRPSHDLMLRLRGQGVPATISGAGPTVLAIGTAEQLEPAVEHPGFALWRLGLGEGVQLSLD
ncbi:MAG: homoserine kinase [Propionibacteriaceae bacterium]|nr:homoserine kinase [Propionibacteriaceae bacterium]